MKSEMVDETLGGLGSDLEMISRPGCVREAAATGRVVEPDKTLQVQLVTHNSLLHCSHNIKIKQAYLYTP